jgi:L-aminopeptidase/D-esterase-like protein
VEIRGLATGSRELDLLTPTHLADRVNAVVLSGGSAFGLAAADGVVDWLARRGEGFETGVTPVPLVPAAVIFDLAPDVLRPDASLGWRACEAASADPVAEGLVGAGAGATVGKALGPAAAAVGGVGSASMSWRDYTVGALAVVNALGDVVDEEGRILAGATGAEGAAGRTEDVLVAGKGAEGFEDVGSTLRAGENTTLVVVGTDAPLSRVDLSRVAGMASAAFARTIVPANTVFDGDITFALSTGGPPRSLSTGDLLGLGVIARRMAEKAIRRGVRGKSPQTLDQE